MIQPRLDPCNAKVELGWAKGEPFKSALCESCDLRVVRLCITRVVQLRIVRVMQLCIARVGQFCIVWVGQLCIVWIRQFCIVWVVQLGIAWAMQLCIEPCNSALFEPCNSALWVVQLCIVSSSSYFVWSLWPQRHNKRLQPSVLACFSTSSVTSSGMRHRNKSQLNCMQRLCDTQLVCRTFTFMRARYDIVRAIQRCISWNNNKLDVIVNTFFFFISFISLTLRPVSSCRYGACELHSVASFLAGAAAQEAVKLITGQFIPVNNTFIYNAIKQTTATLQLWTSQTLALIFRSARLGVVTLEEFGRYLQSGILKKHGRDFLKLTRRCDSSSLEVIWEYVSWGQILNNLG